MYNTVSCHCTVSHTHTHTHAHTRTHTLSYLVSVGLLDRLSVYFGTINGPIEDLPTTQLVLSAINLIVAVTASMHTRYSYT